MAHRPQEASTTLLAGAAVQQGLGCMRLRDDPPDSDRDPVALVNAALDAGVNMLDTADMYRNEALVGRAIRGRRDDVLLCSKFGVVWGEGNDWSVRADPAYVHQACDASLRRLGVGRSTSTTCTTAARPCLSRRRSRPWPGSSRQA